MNNIVQYKVLFASPSDLKLERETFPQIIDELNRVWGKILGFQIVPLMFEHSSAPGISTHSAQSLISQDFGTDYDIFLGAYWQKYGTPTLDALSGTEEEFNNAYKRFCEDPTSVQILFYFKETPPASLSDLNLDDLAKIRTFRTSLEQKNILYWTFTDLSSFEKYIREHLPLRLMDKASRKSLPQSPFQPQLSESRTAIAMDLPAETAQDIVEVETEELGILDYKEELDLAIRSTIECLQNMTAQTENYDRLLQKTVRQLARERKQSSQSFKRIRLIYLSVVAGTDKLSESYETEVPVYLDNFKTVIETMAKIKGFCLNNEATNLEDIKSLDFMMTAIGEAKDSIVGLRCAVAESPCLIKEQKSSNRRLLCNLDNFIDACSASLELTKQFAASIR